MDRWTIDQAVSRGIFVPKNAPEPGKSRLWDFGEAMRFAAMLGVSAFVPLFGGRPRKAAGQANEGPDTRTDAEHIANELGRVTLYGYRDEAAFLLITTIVQPGGKSYSAEVVRASRLAQALARPLPDIAACVGAEKSEAAILINLSAIEGRLLEAWPS